MKRFFSSLLCVAAVISLLAGCGNSSHDPYVPTGDALGGVDAPPSVTENVDQTLTLTYYPMNVPVQAGDITWSSDNESVATVVGDAKGCVITNVGTGKAVITVSLFGKTASVTVYGRESW